MLIKTFVTDLTGKIEDDYERLDELVMIHLGIKIVIINVIDTLYEKNESKKRGVLTGAHPHITRKVIYDFK